MTAVNDQAEVLPLIVDCVNAPLSGISQLNTSNKYSTGSFLFVGFDQHIVVYLI